MPKSVYLISLPIPNKDKIGRFLASTADTRKPDRKTILDISNLNDTFLEKTQFS
jgi:hypothetical protein